MDKAGVIIYTEEFRQDGFVEVSLTTQQECAVPLAPITRSQRSIADFLLEQCRCSHPSINVSGVSGDDAQRRT